MDFEPRTEKQIAERKLWAKGAYEFEVIDAEEDTSQAGNPMIKLTLRLSDGNGSARVISDYLVAKREAKLRHAAAACGVLERYETGCLSDADFAGKRGKLKLRIEKGKNGYSDKNVVADYISESQALARIGARSWEA